MKGDNVRLLDTFILMDYIIGKKEWAGIITNHPISLK
tara:strand:- start:180 stop:290 length:111 start_codon:yes stop_codon:yes gene_type:complete